jgi:hypothetical protein
LRALLYVENAFIRERMRIFLYRKLQVLDRRGENGIKNKKDGHGECIFLATGSENFR